MKSQPIILDASVIAKWFLADETDSDIAVQLLEKVSTRELTLVAPPLLYNEIANIFSTASRQKRMTEAKAISNFKDFLEVEIQVESDPSSVAKALAIALKHSISSYDAHYIALAEMFHIPFITADAKLVEKVANPLIVLLRTYHAD